LNKVLTSVGIGIILILTLVLIIGCNNKTENSFSQLPSSGIVEEPNFENNLLELPEKFQSNLLSDSLWTLGSVVIPGKYADADIINLENGKYRIYYSAEPEVQGFKGQVYSALSNDGIIWTQESGERKEWATFPSIIKLPNNQYRLYYQTQDSIKSAISNDGLTFKDEDGIRIDKINNLGLNLENVAAPTVIQKDNEYIMVYRGTINEKYPSDVPNNNIQLFLWATSKDGLTFEKKGLALDSRNEQFQGLLDGPEFIEWDDGILRLYFWSYSGVYHVDYQNEIFSTPIFEYTNNQDPLKKFPENPPCDPTLIKINNNWFMYYGQHTQGIFYTTLK